MSLKNEIDKLRQIFGYLIVLISGKKESLYNRCKLHVLSTVLVTRITLCCEPNHKQIKRQFSFSMLSCRDTFVVHKLLDCLQMESCTERWPIYISLWDKQGNLSDNYTFIY